MWLRIVTAILVGFGAMLPRVGLADPAQDIAHISSAIAAEPELADGMIFLDDLGDDDAATRQRWIDNSLFSSMFAIAPAKPEASAEGFSQRSLTKGEFAQAQRALRNPKRLTHADLAAVREQIVADAMRSDIERLFSALTVGQGRDLDLPYAVAGFIGRQVAETRIRLLGRILAFDLDGDWEVTTAEIASEAAGTKSGEKLDVWRFDTDRDGILTLPEITTAIDTQTKGAGGPKTAAAKAMLLLDLNGDGMLESDEIGRGILATRWSANIGFAVPKTMAEIEKKPKKFGTAGFRLPDAAATNGCLAPLPTADQEIVMLSGYEVAALSTVKLAEPDRETTLAKIQIEPGEEHLYIIATSFDPIIWQIEGATDRVARFVVQPAQVAQGPGAGLVGLAKDKVTFVPPNGCFSYFSKFSEAGDAITRLAHWAGRTPDQIVASYTLMSVNLPSGQTRPDDRLRAAQDLIFVNDKPFRASDDGYVLDEMPEATAKQLQALSQELYNFYPDGVVEVAPELVLSTVVAVPYDVLPNAAGMIQLIENGSLRVLSGRESLIQKPIAQFPPNLSSSTHPRFILAKGVPLPTGRSATTAVFDEATGKCLTEPICN